MMSSKLSKNERLKQIMRGRPSSTLQRLSKNGALGQILRAIFFYGAIICLGFACSLDDGTEDIIIKQERYQLFFSHSPEADLYMRKHLVDYFQSIALATEYGQSLPFLKKWTKPMSIYASGHLEPALMTELDTIIACLLYTSPSPRDS